MGARVEKQSPPKGQEPNPLLTMRSYRDTLINRHPQAKPRDTHSITEEISHYIAMKKYNKLHQRQLGILKEFGLEDGKDFKLYKVELLTLNGWLQTIETGFADPMSINLKSFKNINDVKSRYIK